MRGACVVIFFLHIVIRITTAQDLCPDPSSILPCSCYVNDTLPSISCVNITHDDQLEKIFAVDFPVTDFFRFDIHRSFIIEISRNVFSNISFQNISLLDSELQYISDDAFDNSKETLTTWTIDGCPITETSFPLNLEDYPLLTYLKFYHNQFLEFPRIISTFLVDLYIEYHYIRDISRDAFAGIPNLSYLNFYYGEIETIEDGALEDLGSLVDLLLSYNNLETLSSSILGQLSNLTFVALNNNQIVSIEPDTFKDTYYLEDINLNNNKITDLSNITFGEMPYLEYLYLSYNQIEFIEPDTFSGTPSLIYLYLGHNNLTTIVTGTFNGLTHTNLYLYQNSIDVIEDDAFGDIEGKNIGLGYNKLTELAESWLRPLLDRNNYVDLKDNPLTCGCDIAWLMENPYETLFARCANGSFIDELDPDFYIENC